MSEKILINATNLKVGGGVQVAVSVISSLLINNRNFDIYYAVSTSVYNQLTIPENLRERFYLIDIIISKPFNFIKKRKRLDKLELSLNIELVFTLFGPAFWQPKLAYHLVGFANAWLVAREHRAYSIYSYTKMMLMKLKNRLLAKLLYDEKNFYVTETEYIRSQFIKEFNSSPLKINVVGNTLSPVFKGNQSIYNKVELIKGIRFLTLTHNYPHKNLKSISKLGKRLRTYGFNVTFIVTIPFNEYSQMSSAFKEVTYNVGPIKLLDCPALYNSCHALYLPTFIECFTVSYLEAMSTGKVIFTSDLPFATEICGDLANYFDPYNEDDIFQVVFKYISNNDITFMKIKYEDILTRFGTNEDRVSKYVHIINKILRFKNV